MSLEFDDIQHILLTRAPAMNGRYEFLSFRSPDAGRAWLAGIMDTVLSAEAMSVSTAEERWKISACKTPSRGDCEPKTTM